MNRPSALTPFEARVFRAVAEAVVDGPVSVDLPERVAPFLARLPPTDRRQLGVLFRIIQAGPLLFDRTPRRFTSLERMERANHLRRWAESRFAHRRSGAAALKAIVALAHYGGEQGWRRTGYGGPWIGRREIRVDPEPEVRGVRQGRRAERDVELGADVCVVGLGAGGCAALGHLAARGVDAVGIEAGGRPGPGDFTQRELDALPLLYQEAGLRATDDQAVGILQGRGVGGSTLHNTGLVYAAPEAILARWARIVGEAFDPVEVMRRSASAVERLGAVPIPSDRINRNNGLLQEGAKRLGWRTRVPLHNRTECSGCGYCMLGCAYNRKWNAAFAYLPEATAAGARILADAPAIRLERVQAGWRVVCRMVDRDGRPTGRTAVVSASKVLVAAGAVDTPVLLQRSGAANAWVGRGLRLHPAALVQARFPEEVVAWRGLPQSVILEELASFLDDGRGGCLGIPSAATQPALAAVTAPGIGPPHRQIMEALSRIAAASALVHDEGAGRVRAARTGRPRVSYRLDGPDAAELRRGIEALGQIYLAAGAEAVFLPHRGGRGVSDPGGLSRAMESFDPAPHRLAISAVHPQGSCPMGGNESTSATDPEGRVRGHEGLYVGDASLFPTSVGVPPQVTTMALAGFVADRVAE